MRGSRLLGVRLLALILCLSFLVGCEDEEARSKAGSAAKEIAELKESIGRLKTELEETKSQLGSVRESTKQYINTRMDALDESVKGAEKKLRDEFSTTAEAASKNFQGRVTAIQADFDARLKNLLQADLAKSLQDLRQEIAKNRDELLGFMDKQLKELYPYAYQPRRVEPNEPPQAPQP